MKGKIAFVVQRYGQEVNGGAELHCRQLAEHMAQEFEVEVITTKAVDYITWKNEYEADEEMLHGVLIRRFSVEKERSLKEFDDITRKAFADKENIESGLEWMRQQGPYAPSLVQYVADHKEDYRVFIFFTYLYYTTFTALPSVKEKAILIPTAHNEPPIYLRIFDRLFHLPAGIFYNTREEKRFIERKFYNPDIYDNAGNGGVGVDLPEDINSGRFYEKYGQDFYLLYIGRIDISKGCEELFHYFSEYKRRNPGPLKLLLMGKPVMEIPDHPDILSLGFVDDRDKFDGLAGAKALVVPSQFESLSMVALEAMSLSIPVLVNGRCDVLRGHCSRSNGGLYYESYHEFEGALRYFLGNDEVRARIGENGAAYVAENYKWNVIVSRLKDLIEQVAAKSCVGCASAFEADEQTLLR